MFLLLSSLLYIYNYIHHIPHLIHGLPYFELASIVVFPIFCGRWMDVSSRLSRLSGHVPIPMPAMRHPSPLGETKRPFGTAVEVKKWGYDQQKWWITVKYMGISWFLWCMFSHDISWYPRFHSRDSMVFRYLQWNVNVRDLMGTHGTMMILMWFHAYIIYMYMYIYVCLYIYVYIYVYIYTIIMIHKQHMRDLTNKWGYTSIT